VTEARAIKVRSALSRQLARPGGRTLAEAERLADAALQTHREDAVAELGALVSRLEAICADPTESGAGQVYGLAAGLVDVAGFFDTGAFYEAAYSLCELADSTSGRETWSWGAVEVHVQALRLLHGSGPGTGGGDALVAGLRQVVAAVTAGPAEAPKSA